VTPLRDREADVAEVQACVARARSAWAAAGAPDNLVALSPDQPSHMTEDELNTLLAWLAGLARKAAGKGFGLRSWH